MQATCIKTAKIFFFAVFSEILNSYERAEEK